uniref:Uncharacterized protein n=1 Tax=Caenorhabditis japonica TaxID=281687 RepID=A0A8R1IPW3_CAEJA
VSDANTRLASEEKKSKKKAKSVKKLAKQPSKIFKKRKRILAKDCPPMEKTQRLMSSRMFLFVFSFYFLSFKIASSPAADHRYAHRAFFEDHHVTNPNKIKYCGNIDVMKSNQKEFLDGIEEACKEYPKRAAEDKKRAAQKQKAPPTEVSQRGGKSVMESHVKVKSGRCLLFEMKPEDEVEVEKPDKKGK